MKYKKFLELAISPVICTATSILFANSITYFCQINNFTSYDPNSRATNMILILSSISVLVSSNILLYFHSNPVSFNYLACLPVNLLVFSLAFSFLLFSREEYHRTELLIYFISSSVILMLSSIFYETRRKFVFLQISPMETIQLRSSKNVRIIQFKPKIVTVLEKKVFSHIDGIIVDDNYHLSIHLQNLIAHAVNSGVRLYTQNEIIERFDGYIPFEKFAPISMRWRTGYELYEAFKRLIDISLCFILFPIFFPIIFISCVFIVLETPGSPIFIQKRVGKRRKLFYIYKLRTMHSVNNGNKIINAVLNDQRVTRVGKILRRTRLDELPQIINIFLGEMSWIGPRPETEELTKIYEQEIPLYLYRLHLRPGISGWAAVNQGYVTGREDTTLKLSYDLFYIKNLSFELDLIILFKTIFVIITGRGAL